MLANHTLGLLQKLLKENTELAAQLEEKTLDYDSMKTSCRVTQRDLNSVQSTLQGIVSAQVFSSCPGKVQVY